MSYTTMPNEQYKEVELVYTVYRAAKIPKDAVVKFSHYGILYYTHQGKTYKTRTMEPGCDYKTHEKVCVNELDTDEEPDEEPDKEEEQECTDESRCEECTHCLRTRVCDMCECVGGCYEECPYLREDE